MSNKYIAIITIAFVILLCISTITGALIAQPPGMPGAPDQAPIDAGLGILALSSGILAYKKLKSLKK